VLTWNESYDTQKHIASNLCKNKYAILNKKCAIIKHMKTTTELIQALLDKGETQDSIAASLGTSQSRISRIINGKTTHIDVELHMGLLSLVEKSPAKRRKKK